MEDLKDWRIDLANGDEVHWNDPDDDICSGWGIFARHTSTWTSIMIKDNEELEVCTKELS